MQLSRALATALVSRALATGLVAWTALACGPVEEVDIDTVDAGAVDMGTMDAGEPHGGRQQTGEPQHGGQQRGEAKADAAVHESAMPDVAGDSTRHARYCAGPADKQPVAGIEVVFSPQPYERSHLARTAQLIDNSAARSIDIAMYGMGDHGIMDALSRAAARGVSIRMLLDTARDNRQDPGGSTAARLEEAGIDVRWVNQIMHHKFAILDGVRHDLEGAVRGVLVTGSANWSYRAGTVYDESTLFIRCEPELLVAFQREFDHLWAYSRDFSWNPELPHLTLPPLPDSAMPDDPSVGAVFTSANFDAREDLGKGPGFSWIRGQRTVARHLATLIGGAERSILLASTHLRSRLVSEALIAKAAANPDMDIRVLLDGQEWISESTHWAQVRRLIRCLHASLGDRDAIDDCLFGGFYFAFELHRQGIPIRFKYYAYRWDYSYARQMHHKLMVIDGRVAVTGSYNLSDNAETRTMENLVIIDGARHPRVVRRMVQELERLWIMGRWRYANMLAELRHGSGPVALVFEPMALGWAQVASLRHAIRQACPAVNSRAYREDPAAHRVCPR